MIELTNIIFENLPASIVAIVNSRCCYVARDIRVILINKILVVFIHLTSLRLALYSQSDQNKPNQINEMADEGMRLRASISPHHNFTTNLQKIEVYITMIFTSVSGSN